MAGNNFLEVASRPASKVVLGTIANSYPIRRGAYLGREHFWELGLESGEDVSIKDFGRLHTDLCFPVFSPGQVPNDSIGQKKSNKLIASRDDFGLEVRLRSEIDMFPMTHSYGASSPANRVLLFTGEKPKKAAKSVAKTVIRADSVIRFAQNQEWVNQLLGKHSKKALCAILPRLEQLPE